MTIRLRIINPAPTPEQVAAWQTVVRPQLQRYENAIACLSLALVLTLLTWFVVHALTR